MERSFVRWSGRSWAPLWLIAIGLSVSTLATPPASERFSPQLEDAFKLYFAGDYDAAQLAARQIGSATNDPRLARDAAALEAMALLRKPARADRIEGRSRLAELANQDASYLDQPECLLAYGVGQTALGATSDAIAKLQAAATAFAQRGDLERAARAYVALAEAWAAHTEWETTPPPYDGPASPDTTTALRQRIAAVRDVRAAMDKVVVDRAAQARIDLVLASLLLKTDDERGAGLAILEGLAGQQPLSPAGVDAALRLAAAHEQAGEFDAALALYERIAAEATGQRIDEARRRAADLTEPRLRLDVAERVAPGTPVSIDFAMRNCRSATLEVRTVDLAGWLARQNGRMQPARLPVVGATAYSKQFAMENSSRAWWSPATSPVQVSVAPGAYVVYARAIGTNGQPTEQRRLVLVSDVSAMVQAGAKRAVVAATRGRERIDQGVLKFWMHGSFVPLEVPLGADGASFDLPGEAQVFRDKRWVGLVEADGELALCTGQLPTAPPPPAEGVRLFTAPPTVSPGDALQISGALVRPGAEALAPQTEAFVEVRDTLGELVAELPVGISRAGVFSTELPIPAELAGTTLSINLRIAGQLLPPAEGAVTVPVASLDELPLQIDFAAPNWVRPGERQIRAAVAAAWPWGQALSDVGVHVSFAPDGLPTATTPERVGRPFALRAALGPDGQGKFEFSSDYLARLVAPVAATAVLSVTDWSGRGALVRQALIYGDAPAHAWFGHDVNELKVGRAASLRVGYFDPRRPVLDPLPAVTLPSVDGGLPLLPTSTGLVSQPWTPTVSGEVSAELVWPVDEGAPTTIRRQLTIAPNDDATALNMTAQFVRGDDGAHVRATLIGALATPAVVLLRDDEPRAVKVVPAFAGGQEVSFETQRSTGAGLNVVAGIIQDSGFEPRADVAAAPAERAAAQLAVQGADMRLTPRGVATYVVTLEGASRLKGDADEAQVWLLARLVDLRDAGFATALPERHEGRAGATDDPEAPPTPRAAKSAWPHDLPNDIAIVRSLRRAVTHWTAVSPLVDGRTEIAVPLPAEPASYRLEVVAFFDGAPLAAKLLPVDTRGGLWLRGDRPLALQRGDRTVAGLEIFNPGPAEAEIAVSASATGGVSVEQLTLVDMQGRQLAASGEGAPARLTLAPGARCFARTQIEAGLGGSGELTVRVASDGAVQEVATVCQVNTTMMPDESRVPVRVARAVYVLTPEPITGELDPITGQTMTDRKFMRLTAAPNERFHPGQTLLIDETVELPRQLTEVEWRQDIPPVAVTDRKRVADVTPLGDPSGPLRLDRMDIYRSELERGTHSNQYTIVVVRPGACVLPPPVIRSDGGPVRVVCEPEDLRLVVEPQ